MTQAFRKDIDDEDRPGIHWTNIVWYYNRYYNKQLTHAHYEAKTLKDLLTMIKDTVKIVEESSLLQSELGEDVEATHIMKMVEEIRRERVRRLDAGDETARIKFNKAIQLMGKPGVAAPATAKPVGVLKTVTTVAAPKP